MEKKGIIVLKQYKLKLFHFSKQLISKLKVHFNEENDHSNNSFLNLEKPKKSIKFFEN